MKPVIDTEQEVLETQSQPGLWSKMQKGAGKAVDSFRTKANNLLGGGMIALTAATGSLVAPTAVGVATTAALSEKAEGASIAINLQGLSNSTISSPQKIAGTALQTNSSLYNSELIYLTPQAGANITTNTSIESCTLTLSPTDIGAGGSLTFTFRLRAGTDSSTATNSGTGIANTQYRVLQELRFGLQGGPSQMLAFLDSGARTNNQFNSLNPDEEWHADSGMMTYTIPNFTQAGTYALDNALFTQNSTGVCRLSGTEISFTPNIPEPSVPLLAGIAGTLALLRRKRNDTESTNTSTS